MQDNKEKSVLHLLFGAQMEKQRKEVYERRCVLLQIINVIKLIGDKNEAAYRLDDDSLNHGNFLEIILLLSNTDNILKSHVQKSIELSKKAHQSAVTKGNKKYGRGSLVTFLSSTIVTNIIQHIGHEIQNITLNQVKEAKMFSIMMDTRALHGPVWTGPDWTRLDRGSVLVRLFIYK
jgi:hypothetical protein